MIRTMLFPKDRYWYFRSCHAATVVPTGPADYLVAYFAGTYEKHDDTAIWTVRSEDGGDWQVPVKVADVGPVPHWNPVLFSPGNGEIWLFFKVGKTIPGWRTYVTQSTDQGLTWGEPHELVPGDTSGGRGPVKNKPIVLAGGDWLAPGSIETAEDWRAFTDRGSDGGKTWTRSNFTEFGDPALSGKGVIQPTLWESQPGRIHMLLRSTCGRICRSDSSDNGQTWSPAMPIDMPNNNSGIDLAQCPDGRLFLACNPTDQGAKRTPLTIFTSEDNAATWRRCVDLETDDVTVGHLYRLDGGEFSYPSIIHHDGNLVCVYTCHRRQIAFCRMTASELLKERTNHGY